MEHIRLHWRLVFVFIIGTFIAGTTLALADDASDNALKALESAEENEADQKKNAKILDGAFAGAISTVTMAYANALMEDENTLKTGWKLEEPITVGDWTFDVRAVCHENGAPGGPPVWIKAVSGPISLDPALFLPGTEFERTYEVCPE